MLKGQQLLAQINAIRNDEANACRVIPQSEIVLACGYVKEGGKPDFTGFYTELLEAKGYILGDPAFEKGTKAHDLSEIFGGAAVSAFIEIWSEEDLDYFEDAYIGEYESGAAYAKEFVEESWGLDVPSFVEVNWEATWDNLSYDFYEQDGFIFNANW